MQRKTERRDKEREGKRERGRAGIQREEGGRERERGRGEGSEQQRHAAAVFCAAGLPLPCWVREGMQGRPSSGAVQANQHFGGV